MTANKRFSGLMGAPEPSEGDPAVAPVATSKPAEAVPEVSPGGVPLSDHEPPSPRARAKVQLNTQQPEQLKIAVDRAAAYLSYTTGSKVTTTDIVERALRDLLKSGAFPAEVTTGLTGKD